MVLWKVTALHGSLMRKFSLICPSLLNKAFVGINLRAYPISNDYLLPAIVHLINKWKKCCVKQAVLIFLGQKLSSRSIQQASTKVWSGGRRGGEGKNLITWQECMCICLGLFSNLSCYTLVSHAISNACDKWHVYFLKWLDGFSGESSKEWS